MRKITSLTTVILVFTLPFFLIACAGEKVKEAKKPAEGAATEQAANPDYTDPGQLAKLIETGEKEYYLIDVRTAEEFESGYIPTAINIPYDVIAENLPTEDRDALIIVYCRSGARASRAKQTLEELGYTNIINFGAVADWEGELLKGGS